MWELFSRHLLKPNTRVTGQHSQTKHQFELGEVASQLSVTPHNNVSATEKNLNAMDTTLDFSLLFLFFYFFLNLKYYLLGSFFLETWSFTVGGDKEVVKTLGSDKLSWTKQTTEDQPWRMTFRLTSQLCQGNRQYFLILIMAFSALFWHGQHALFSIKDWITSNCESKKKKFFRKFL